MKLYDSDGEMKEELRCQDYCSNVASVLNL